MSAREPLLAGIKVLDLSRIIAGPFACRMLADMGAEVTKVETPVRGDDTRGWIRGEVQGVAVSPVFATLNAGKRSVALDLHDGNDRAAFLGLCDGADVLLHNFRPGVVERLGIDAATVRARNPRLVYCGISGFGTSGPRATHPGNDIIAQAYGGLMSVLGNPGDVPIRCTAPVGDLNAGYNAVVGVLGALLRRERTGEGAVVETSLLEAVVGMMGHYFTDYAVTGEVPGPMGSRNKFGQPNQAFPTVDGAVVVAAVNDPMWERVALALDLGELAQDPRFARQPARVRNQEELERILAPVFATRTTAEWIERLERADVLCAPVAGVDAVMTDPQVRHLGLFEVTDVGGAQVPVVAGQFTVDGHRAGPGAVPALGEGVEGDR